MLEQLSGSAGPAPTQAIHIGDISYARGYSYIWEYFMNQVWVLMMELLLFGNSLLLSQIAPLASSVPYMVGIGNHVSLQNTV